MNHAYMSTPVFSGIRKISTLGVHENQCLLMLQKFLLLHKKAFLKSMFSDLNCSSFIKSKQRNIATKNRLTIL